MSRHSWLSVFIFAVATYVGGEAVAGDGRESRDVPTLQEVLKATKPGTRLRVAQTDGAVIEGGLVESDRLTIFNPVEERQYVLEWGEVDTLWELQVSKARGQRVGGAIGLTLGAVAGFYAGLAVSGLCFEGNCDDSPDVGLVVSGAFLGGLVGGCAGLLIGNVVSEGKPEWILRYPVNDAKP